MAALALLGSDLALEVVDYIRSSSRADRLGDLDRQANPLLPPPIFSRCGALGRNSDEQGYLAILGTAFTMLEFIRDRFHNEWRVQMILQDFFLYDEVEAARVAKKVFSPQLPLPPNIAAMLGPRELIVTNSDNVPLERVVAYNTDLAFELGNLGKALIPAVERLWMMTTDPGTTLDESVRRRLNYTTTVLMGARDSLEKGDPVDWRAVEHELKFYGGYPLIPLDETGGLFSNIGNWISNAVNNAGDFLGDVANVVVTAAQDFMTSPVGSVLTGATAAVLTAIPITAPAGIGLGAAQAAAFAADAVQQQQEAQHAIDAEVAATTQALQNVQQAAAAAIAESTAQQPPQAAGRRAQSELTNVITEARDMKEAMRAAVAAQQAAWGGVSPVSDGLQAAGVLPGNLNQAASVTVEVKG